MPATIARKAMSAILDFYRGTGGNGSGWRMDEVLSWSDAELEVVHDYIQWLFPLPEKSMANPFAPEIDKPTIAAFHKDAALQEALRSSLRRMLAFYGFAFEGDAIVPAPDYSARASNWLTPGNHNHLRLTRMLRSLRVLGLEAEARALWQALQVVYASDAGKQSISERTYKFWTRAATEEMKVSTH
jgi:hypothetical protein